MLDSLVNVFSIKNKNSPKESRSISANDPNLPKKNQSHERRSMDGPITEAKVRGMYDRPTSFTAELPWIEYVPESQTFLLEDLRSNGVMFEILPRSTEGRSMTWIAAVRDSIKVALQDSFPENDATPWIMQMYTFDDPDLSVFADRLDDYVWDHAKGTEFTKEYLAIMRAHLEDISQPGGLFIDEGVTGCPWQGKIRRCFIFIYRRLAKNTPIAGGLTPAQEVNNVANSFIAALNPSGVGCRRCGGKDFYSWMLRWFNPAPPITNGDKEAFYNVAEYPGDENMGIGHDFAESFFYSMPKSDSKTGTWWFDGLPHRSISIDGFRSAPRIGLTTGEIPHGDASYAMFDKMPPGTIMAITVVFTPQDVMENHFNFIKQKSMGGETTQSKLAYQDVVNAQEVMKNNQSFFHGMITFYLKANDMDEMSIITNEACSTLLNFGIKPVFLNEEKIALDTYKLNLPMVYNPLNDKRNDGMLQRMRPFLAEHIACISPFFGRSTGTGNPGFMFFNRGAAPFTCDPLSLKDRKKNGHMLILGPTGAGKSATMTYLMSQMMGVARPRLYIVEAGNSFGLQADYFKSKGLTVNKIQLKPGAGVSMPPFADAYLVLNRDDIEDVIAAHEGPDSEKLSEDSLARLNARLEVLRKKEGNDDDDDDDEDQEDSQRDVMGEMEIIATLMVTGGEEKEAERMTRADRKIVRMAVVEAAKKAFVEGRITLTRDVLHQIRLVTNNQSAPEIRRNRAYEMAEAMEMFTMGMEGELFDTIGDPWPETDVTLIDLATYAREGYQAQLAVAYTSIMLNINNVAEKYQHTARPLVMLTDEAHIITTNPLLAPFVVKVVKMWRKLGAWYHVATQNLEDFPNSAKKMLNMIEWWMLLVMPKEEVENIGRFKSLTKDQEYLLLSARKEPKKYTEGVILSENVESLFRNVPPSLYLALAMTEKDEKVERADIMKERKCSEVEAAIEVARRMDVARGIKPKCA